MARSQHLLLCAAVLVFASCADKSPREGGHDHGDDAGHDHGDEPSHDHGDDADHDHAGAAHDHGDGDHSHEALAPAIQTEPWAVTAWGDKFEIFAECDPLAAGGTSVSNTHVTVLQGFAPLRAGTVTAILRGGPGAAEFRQEAPKRDGIYAVSITPALEGEFELAFRVETPSGTEEIPAGRVRVGTAAEPGGLLGRAPVAGDVPFLKEQQWRTEFATAAVSAGAIRESVRGPGRVRAAAGGEVILSAPLDGLVRSDANFHVGRSVRRGGTVVSLAPRAGGDRTLAELEADLDVANRRLARMEELVRVEAVSVADVEAARARVASLEPRVAAAKGDLAAAGLAPIPAPFDGRIAEVFVTAGESVASGAPLARFVRTDPVWIDVDLRPEDAARVGGEPVGLLVRPGASAGVVSFDPKRVRSVGTAPSIDPRTGTIGALFEVSGATLPLGQIAEVEVLLARERAGIVIPADALVDDGGVPIVYVQPEGESFARREVTIVARQGEQLLVEGIEPGERLVTLGGAAIRRASLTTSTLEGHVH